MTLQWTIATAFDPCHTAAGRAFHLLMKAVAESELVAALARGSAEAFDSLYATYSGRLMRFLLQLTRDVGLAEDLFQEGWLKLARAADGLLPDTEVFPWLLRVSRNAWISRLRRERRLSPLDEPEAYVDPAPLPDQRFEAGQLEQGLLRAMERLSPTDRELLLLVAVEGLAQEQVAEIVGVSAVALRQRLSRARARLLALLADAEVTALVPTRLQSVKGAVR